MDKKTEVEGVLEVDHDRGVIYFHSAETGWTVLRICRLPKPVPPVSEMLDVTHMTGASWGDTGSYPAVTKQGQEWFDLFMYTFLTLICILAGVGAWSLLSLLIER